VNPVTSTGCISVDTDDNANPELVDKFCYLGDMSSETEILMQLWRPKFELDGINSESRYHRSPIRIDS